MTTELTIPPNIQHKPITIPFRLFVDIFFNGKNSFLENGDAYKRESMVVSEQMAKLFLIFDKDEQFTKVLAPRSMFNDTNEWKIYTKEAWQTSERFFLIAKAQQEFSQEQFYLREEKIKEMTAAFARDTGCDKNSAEQFARLKVMMRDVTFCKMFGVDISALDEEHTRKTRIL